MTLLSERKSTIWPHLAITSAVLAVLVLGAGLWLSSQAKMVQLVRPDAAASLFAQADSVGTPIGSPQAMLIFNQDVFLPERGPNNLYYVNEPLMREKGVYPLQLKTVQFVRNLVLGALLSLTLVFGILALRRP